MEHKKLEQDGVSIHYYCSGEKERESIMFLHPAFADHRCFDKQVEFFSRDHRTITIDMPGHGSSQTGGSRVGVDMTPMHMNAILELEGHDKVHLVGVSMGSLIAQYFALKHPSRVMSMTAVGGYDINADNRDILKAQRGEQMKWIFKALFSMDAFRRHVAEMAVSDPEQQARFHEMAQTFKRSSFRAMAGLGRVVQKREGIRSPWPLLIVCGGKDIELARRSSQAWHGSEPGSRFDLIPDAGHCANMDQPELFNALLRDHIRRSHDDQFHTGAIITRS
jgi:3-oxoadipate enol-lactonase